MVSPGALYPVPTTGSLERPTLHRTSVYYMAVVFPKETLCELRIAL
jgi:hypothetical protein